MFASFDRQMPLGQWGVYVAAAAAALLLAYQVGSRRRQRHLALFSKRADSLRDLIGNTPLMLIRSLSEATGCQLSCTPEVISAKFLRLDSDMTLQILGKAEFLNPGGSVKDRVALEIIEEALGCGALRPGGLVTEGTVGSTGVSLAMVAAARGLRCFIAMPDDAAIEKSQMLEALGAEVQRVRPVSISNPDHFVNIARRRAAAEPGAVFADQFENLANLRAHYATGSEILAQTGGRLDAFVCGAGTGGTIAGVSHVLKRHDPRIRVLLVDPPGSSLYNKVTRGVLYARAEAEGTRLRNPYDTIVEGIGLNRLTANFGRAHVDDAVRGSDQEAVSMAQHLLHQDGLFVGSSAAMNCVGAVKVARQLGPGHTIVTILCDAGHRHLSKFHNPEYLRKYNLDRTHSSTGLDFVQ